MHNEGKSRVYAYSHMHMISTTCNSSSIIADQARKWVYSVFFQHCLRVSYSDIQAQTR